MLQPKGALETTASKLFILQMGKQASREKNQLGPDPVGGISKTKIWSPAFRTPGPYNKEAITQQVKPGHAPPCLMASCCFCLWK